MGLPDDNPNLFGEYEYEPNMLHTTEILVADITFVFLFHTRQSNCRTAIGEDAHPKLGKSPILGDHKMR
jgi:hypothetical protein